jgi:hypothetical protein
MHTRRLAVTVAALAIGVGAAGGYAVAQGDGASAPAKVPATKTHKAKIVHAPVFDAPRGHDCHHQNAVTPAV